MRRSGWEVRVWHRFLTSNIAGVKTCPSDPVQWEGEIEGHRFYFRQRGKRWAIYLGAVGGSTEDAIERPEFMLEGTLDDELTVLSDEQVWGMLVVFAAAWRR